jgi:hypothetical protein
MRLRRPRSILRSERGSALLAALCLAMVFALSLSSFIALSYTSLSLSARNVMSSHSIELAEAGLEDGLYLVNGGGWAAWPMQGGVPTLTLPIFNFENGTTGAVTVSVLNYPGGPLEFQSTAVVGNPNGVTVTRTLQTTLEFLPSFTNAAGATSGLITFKSGGLVDSYNSSLGSYGSMVGAPAAPNQGYSAIIVSQMASGSPSVQLGSNTVVNGYVIGTGSTPESYSSGSQVKGPDTSGSVSVDSSRVLSESNPNLPILNENYPSTGTVLNSTQTTLTGNQVVTLGSPTATAPTSYYVFGNLNLSGNSVLNINGPVILLVYGNVSISDSAQIAIGSTSMTLGGGPLVSLEMHVPYGNLNIDGGGIANATQSPERLLVMSSWSASAALEVGTTTPFYGVLDFPNDSIVFNNNTVLYGSVVAGSMTFNNTPAIHYDTYLQSQFPLSASFMGPRFNAFTSSGQGTSSVRPMTVTSVLEIPNP